MTRTDYIRSTARTVLYAYVYVALEWLFFITKPSFMSAWSPLERVYALLMGALPFVLATLAVHALCCLAAFAASRSSRLVGRAPLLLRVTPSLVTVAIVMMLADNFTYTVFHWGIVDTTLYTAPIYWAAGLLVFVLHMRRQPSPLESKPLVPVLLVLASIVILVGSLLGTRSFQDPNVRSAWEGPQLPNIIVFASDGIPADHLSAYGYQRKTTPNLDAYLDQALVADNAFTNSVLTTGSLSSLMTGKYPATTKLLLPPHTLKGKDAYQSLPRILHKLGYTNMQETVRYYADGPDLNWQESFDLANGRNVHWLPINRLSLSLQGALELSDQLGERLSDRVQQLIRTKQMANAYAAVTGKHDVVKVGGTSDKKRMERVADFIRSTRGPFFIHIHLMETHCCSIHVGKRVRHFSAGMTGNGAQAKAAKFDDAVLRADGYFGQMMRTLERQNLLDNTVVVYTSDHDKGWDFRTPVPLVFVFPGGEHKGHIAATSQLLDVAPTLLDYLKVDVPEWMEGQSLLRGEPHADRPVFTIFQLKRKRIKTENGEEVEQVVNFGPPKYGLETLGMVVCHRWYLMNVRTRKVHSGQVGEFENHMRAVPGAPLSPTACSEGDAPDDDEALPMMREHLIQRGFSFEQRD